MRFKFAANPYFSNSELSKKFIYIRQPNGLELQSTEGALIEWKSPDKNATIELIRREVRGKRGGGGGRGRGRGRQTQAAQFETIEQPRDSFFRFFSMGEMDDDDEEMDEEAMVRSLALLFVIANSVLIFVDCRRKI